MSADTLFRSIPITPLNNVQNNNTNTPVVISKPVVTTPNVEVPVLPSASAKKDLSSIPPVFFVGPQKKEKTVIFEPQFSSDSGSVIGYGDRRLSGILAQTAEEETEEEETVEVPVKRIILDEADANRGIFGDKRKAKNKTSASIHIGTLTNNIEEDTTMSHVSPLQPSKTIRVFGYPLNLVHNVIQHFATYGKIESYHETSGNWMTITYESSTYALAALKANGIIISNSHMIGVALEKEEPTTIQNVIPLEESQGVFKSLHGLGSGKVGKSAIDPKNKHSDFGDTMTGGSIISRLKDALLGW